jgi:hypothetical protein
MKMSLPLMQFSIIVLGMMPVRWYPHTSGSTNRTQAKIYPASVEMILNIMYVTWIEVFPYMLTWMCRWNGRTRLTTTPPGRGTQLWHLAVEYDVWKTIFAKLS